MTKKNQSKACPYNIMSTAIDIVTYIFTRCAETVSSYYTGDYYDKHIKLFKICFVMKLLFTSFIVVFIKYDLLF